MDSALPAELFADFAAEAHERLDRLEEILLAATSATPRELGELLEEIRRELHTLKGNSGMMGLGDLQALAHQLEDEVERFDPAQPVVEPLLAGVDRFRTLMRAASGVEETGEAPELTASGVRIPFGHLDSLIDLLAEVVIARNRLADVLERSRPLAATVPALDEAWSEIDLSHERLASTLDLLQDGVIQLRMVPLATLFRQLNRIVHDQCIQEGKEVYLETEGGDTPLDKALLELASEALGHLVRNAVIHGIETPEERQKAGKIRHGTLRLSARTTARDISIGVEDDGRGVDPVQIQEIAARRGVRLGAGEDPLQLLFLPGFSTRAAADLEAGRGIGLAAVQEAVRRQGGSIEVESHQGVGTYFQMRLPLSASITRALLVRSDGEEYALPIRSVVESIRLSPGVLHEINGAEVLRWRGRVLPAIDLGVSFGTNLERRQEGYAIVLEDNAKLRAVVVDQLQGIREIVVKRLDPLLGSPAGISGSTILGDGRAILILDPAGLIEFSPFLETAS